jgi:glycosyltransferase involved in cell wall biosynthesis
MADISRIVIISPSLDISKNIGGISTVAGFVIKNNKKYNYSHFELGKYDKEKRSAFYLLRILKGWINWFFLMFRGKNIILHFNIALEKRSLIRDAPLLLLAHFLKKKLVIHIHGGFYLEKEEMPKWIKTVLTSILSGNEPKIVLSSLEQELIVRKYQAKNVFVLPNSLDTEEAKKFKRVCLTETPLRLLFIGRIVKDKGIEYIFEALKVLREREVSFKFIMAGSGEDKDEYVGRFSETLGESFEYRGVISGDAKTDLLKECNVFLLPSFYEGLPISLLECMSFAQVPVVTDVGSIKNVVKDGLNGIIIRKYSSEDIYEAIIKLNTEKDLMVTLGTAAQEDIFNFFNPVKYIEELNRIYDLA